MEGTICVTTVGSRYVRSIWCIFWNSWAILKSGHAPSFSKVLEGSIISLCNSFCNKFSVLYIIKYMLKTKYRINLKERIREGMGQVSQVAFEAHCLELWGRKGCLRAGDRVVGAWRRWEPLALSVSPLSGGNCGDYSLRRNLQLAWPPSHAAFCYTQALSSHNKSNLWPSQLLLLCFAPIYFTVL